MRETPNLYAFATKELAQDATIAYIIAWADPAHRRASPRLHALGTELLRELVASYKGTQLPAVESLCVETQVRRIDVRARINNKEGNGLILLIEDKVHTDQRPNQIPSYKEQQEQEHPRAEVVPVYVKTGNASRNSLPDQETCGQLLRGDLLEVLRQFPDTGDTIVDNFRRHLEHWEEQSMITSSRTSFDDLTDRRCEGFYVELEQRLLEAGKLACRYQWAYVPNSRGGDIVFWVYGHQVAWAQDLCGRNMEMYLQIQRRGRELAVRVSAQGVGRIDRDHMYAVLPHCTSEPPKGIKVEKAGRFGGGGTAAVARLANWQNVVAPEGVIEVTKAVEFLVEAEEFIQKVAAQPRA